MIFFHSYEAGRSIAHSTKDDLLTSQWAREIAVIEDYTPKKSYTLGAEPEVPKGLASHTWIFSSLSEATLTPDLAEQVANKLHHTILFTPHAIPHHSTPPNLGTSS